MVRRSHLLLAVMAASLLTRQALAADPLPPRTSCVPRGAILVADLSRPEALLNLALNRSVLDIIRNHESYRQQSDQPGFKQFTKGVQSIEKLLNADWQTILRRLGGGGVTLASTPEGGFLLVSDATDEKLVEQVHNLLFLAAVSQAGKPKGPGTISKQDGEWTRWSFGTNAYFVLMGKRLVLANRETLLQTALALQAGKGKGLAAEASFKSARATSGENPTATLFVDLAAVKKNPQLKAGLDQANNPWATLFFASLIEAVKESSWLGLTLQVEKDRLSLNLALDRQLSADLYRFTQPSGKDGALPALSVPGQIASVSLYRDLKSYYAAKDKLFPQRTSQLIFFENMMAIFFSGRNLTDEVFGEWKPEFRLVVAAQADHYSFGTPEVKLPGFALVIRLHNPKEFKDTAEEAWQKALGLVGIIIGQKGQSGMILDRDMHEGVKYQLARFTAPRGMDRKRLPMQYNLRPAMVLMDDSFVVSSTEALARDLIVALKKEKATPAAGVNSLVEFDGNQLARILSGNRISLVLQNMTEKGNTRERAEGEVDVLISLFKYPGKVRLSMGGRDGKTHANVTIQLNLP